MLEFLAICGALSIGYAAGEIARHAVRWYHGRDTMERVTPEPAAPQQPAFITDDEFTIVDRWVKLNPWYMNNLALNREARMVHMVLANREPHLSLEANLAAVSAEMHRRHPEIAGRRN